MAVVLAVLACGLMALLGWAVMRLLCAALRLRDQVLLAPAMGMSVAVLVAVAEGLIHRRPTAVDIAVLTGVLLIACTRMGLLRVSVFRVALRRALVYVTPGALLLVVLLVTYHGLPYPSASDSITNSSLTQWFLLGHYAPPQLPDYILGTTGAEQRFGIGFVGSVIGEISGLNAGLSTTVAAWFALFAMPLSLMAFVSRAGLDDRTTVLAGFCALGFGFAPFRPLILGQEPLLAGGYVIAPAAAVLAWDALSHRSWRLTASAVLAVSGLYYMHFADAPTALLLLGAITVANARRWRVDKDLVVRVLALGVGVAVCVAPGFRYHATSLPIAVPALGHSNVVSADKQRLLVYHSLSSFFTDVLGSYVTNPAGFLAAPAAIVGFVAARRQRVAMAFGLLAVVLLVLQFDAWMWQWPRSLYRSFVPWDDPERLVYLTWFVIAPLAALGVLFLAEGIRSSASRRRLATLILAAAVVIPGLTSGATLIPFAQMHLVAVDDTEAAAVVAVGHAVPPDELVLTDGIADSGAWIPVLTRDQVLLNTTWQDTSAAGRIEDVLRDLCAPGAAAELRALHVQWVFLGTHLIDAVHYVDRSCLGGTAVLRPVAIPGGGTDGPWLFRVGD